MPVAKETHDEGEHWIIVTPSAEWEPQFRYNGYAMNTRFKDGVARTTSQYKAQVFDEQYGYEVIPYEGAPTWHNIPDPTLPKGDDSDWSDGDIIVVDEDEWVPATGQFEKPVSAAKSAKMGLQPVAAGDAGSDD